MEKNNKMTNTIIFFGKISGPKKDTEVKESNMKLFSQFLKNRDKQSRYEKQYYNGIMQNQI